MRFGALCAWTVVAAITGSTSVLISMPPVNAESSEPTMRDMGRLGSHIAGHYWTLGSSHYVWYNHGSGCFDPGTFDTSLSGYTGIEVPLAAGNNTATQVASASAAAIDGVGSFTSVANGTNVEVTGTSIAAAGSVPYASATNYGLVGTQYSRLSAIGGATSFGQTVMAGAVLTGSVIPTGSIIITGFRVSIGSVHNSQLTVGIYQGGVSDSDSDGATLVGIVGSTTGSATTEEHFVPAESPFSVDPANGRIWAFWSSDASDTQCIYAYDAGNPDQLEALSNIDWITATNIIHNSSTPSVSDSSSWPLTMSATSGGSVATPPIALSYIEAANFQNDMFVVGRFGTRAAASDLTGISSATLLVGNSFNAPPSLGMSVYDASIAYNVHDAASHYRLSLAVGGTANNDFSGATWYDIGIASGTSTGWVDVLAEGTGAIDIPASTRVFITTHHTSGVSSFLFDPLAPDIYGPASNPAAYYNGETSETEVDDGTLGGTATTNVTFDETVAQSGTITPDGTVYNNGNNAGIRMRYAIRGFSVS